MKVNSMILSIFVILALSSCASSTPRKNIRSEKTEKVAKDSAEMINVKLGVGYLKRGKPGDLDVALEKFKKAIGFNPKFALAHSMIANVYDRKGLFDSAEKHYKLSMKYNNDSPDITNNYANYLCQRGSYDLAVEKYMEVVENPLYETPAAAYENAGICSIRNGKSEQAENYFRKALGYNGAKPNALFQLMLIQLKNKKYFKALAFLQRLEQVVQPSSEMLAAGYKIEKGLKHDDLANIYLKKLKKNFPSSESIKTLTE